MTEKTPSPITPADSQTHSSLTTAFAYVVVIIGVALLAGWVFDTMRPYMPDPPSLKITRQYMQEEAQAIKQKIRAEAMANPTDEELAKILALATERGKATKKGTVLDYLVIEAVDWDTTLNAAEQQGHAKGVVSGLDEVARRVKLDAQQRDELGKMRDEFKAAEKQLRNQAEKERP